MYLDFFLVEILQNPLNFNLPLLSVWWIAPPGRKSQRGILINQFTILINFRPQVLILQPDMLSFPITPWSPFLAWPQYKRACWYRQQILSPAPMWSHTATAKGSKQNTISTIFILFDFSHFSQRGCQEKRCLIRNSHFERGWLSERRSQILVNLVNWRWWLHANARNEVAWDKPP